MSESEDFISFQIDQVIDKELISLMPERQLWCGVLLQALSDATGKRTKSVRTLRSYQQQARKWFYEGGSDFKAVCWLAGLDADAVQKIVIDRYLAHSKAKAGKPNKGKQGAELMSA
ncbi:hypothetical protein [Methylosarcina fibrata]|uniref:hypothetical protein n=1 Tax=Methylosarcina fibrata TaxID=105972 RepID=UPI00037AA152|nr:hypothetical protein [Methylosarcina fibrata]